MSKQKLTIEAAIKQESRRKVGTKGHVSYLKSGVAKGMSHVKYTGNQVDYFYNPETGMKYDADWGKLSKLKGMKP